MERFKAIQKGVITSLFGIGMLVVVGHQYYVTGQIDFGVILGALAGGGFLFTKDQRASHTKDK
jgi:hypothetical protein